MKYAFVLHLFFIFTLPSSAQVTHPLFDTAMRRMGAAFAADTATQALSVGILYNNTTSTYHFGRQMPDDRSVYEVGSVTKTFVGLVLAHAVAEGKMHYNDDVRKYLPAGFSALDYEGHPVRVLHLANSTACLPDNLPAIPDTFTHTPPDSIPFVKERIFHQFTDKDFLRALSGTRPDTIPGTRGAALQCGRTFAGLYPGAGIPGENRCIDKKICAGSFIDVQYTLTGRGIARLFNAGIQCGRTASAMVR